MKSKEERIQDAIKVFHTLNDKPELKQTGWEQFIGLVAVEYADEQNASKDKEIQELRDSLDQLNLIVFLLGYITGVLVCIIIS